MSAIASWTAREALAAIFFCSYLLLQIVLPTLQLIEPGPRRFAWQMFSRVGHARPEFYLLSGSSERQVDLARHVVRLRAEIDLSRVLPPHLCEVYPRVDSVRIVNPTGRVDHLACRRPTTEAG